MLPTRSPPSSTCSLDEYSESFYKLLQDIIECLNEYLSALEMLKQALASLVLPLDDGRVASIVDPSLYNNAKSVVEVFSSLSCFINPLSFNLLWFCVNSTKCSAAVAKIRAFDRLRMSNGSLILCSNSGTVPTTPEGLNDLSTAATPDAKAAHSASLDQLQSDHFATHAVIALPKPKQCMRISVRISRKSMSIADYECLLTAISGYFILPKCALTYIGCTEHPLCLSWVVSNELQAYIMKHRGGISGECMLSEQGVVNLMVGDWLNDHCLTETVSVFILPSFCYYFKFHSQESQYYFCVYYGLFDRLKSLLAYHIGINTVNGVSMLAEFYVVSKYTS